MSDSRPSRRLMVQSAVAGLGSSTFAIGLAVGQVEEGRRPTSLSPDYFRGMYATDPDPWRFATSAYERDKYAATLAAIPRDRYVSGLDVGCSIGVFTHQLCPRCDALVGIDVVPSALDQARTRCADCPNASFQLAAVPRQWPDGRFDLIVISEVAYYLVRADLARLVSRVGEAVLPGADIVLVHWLGTTDYPLSGDAAAEGFIADASRFARPLKQSRTSEYRLDVLRVT